MRGSNQIRQPELTNRKLNSSSWLRVRAASNKPISSNTSLRYAPNATVSTWPAPPPVLNFASPTPNGVLIAAPIRCDVGVPCTCSTTPPTQPDSGWASMVRTFLHNQSSATSAWAPKMAIISPRAVSMPAFNACGVVFWGLSIHRIAASFADQASSLSRVPSVLPPSATMTSQGMPGSFCTVKLRRVASM